MAHLYCCVVHPERSRDSSIFLCISGETVEAQLLKEAIVELLQNPPQDVVSCDKAHFRCVLGFLQELYARIYVPR